MTTNPSPLIEAVKAKRADSAREIELNKSSISENYWEGRATAFDECLSLIRQHSEGSTLIEAVYRLKGDETTPYNRGLNCGLDAAANIIRQHSEGKPAVEQQADAKTALWVLEGKSPEAQQSFMVNWLRGTLVVPDEVKLRIWLAENGRRGLKPNIDDPTTPERESTASQPAVDEAARIEGMRLALIHLWNEKGVPAHDSDLPTTEELRVMLRAAQSAVEAQGDEGLIRTARALADCAASWESDARLVGNVRAADIWAMCVDYLNRPHLHAPHSMSIMEAATAGKQQDACAGVDPGQPPPGAQPKPQVSEEVVGQAKEALYWVNWLFEQVEFKPLLKGAWGDPEVIFGKVKAALAAMQAADTGVNE